MLCRDMIVLMEKLIANNEPHRDVMGEAEIYIDVFRLAPDKGFAYSGISGHVRVSLDGTGVYHVLDGFDPVDDDALANALEESRERKT